MANRDLVYVSNAPLVEVEKIVTIFNGVLAPASQTANVAATATAFK
jgi:hypothetical protein